MISAICAPVRSGASAFNATANANNAPSVRGLTRRTRGYNPRKPPSRYALTHRPIVVRDTDRNDPSTYRCTPAAKPRASAPRSRALSSTDSKSRISP